MTRIRAALAVLFSTAVCSTALLGAVTPLASAQPPVGRVVELDRFVTFHGDEHISSTDDLNFGPYHREGRLGWVRPYQVYGSHGIYQCLSGRDLFTSTDVFCEGRSQRGLIGYLYDTRQPTSYSVALYRCFVPGNGDTSTRPTRAVRARPPRACSATPPRPSKHFPADRHIRRLCGRDLLAMSRRSGVPMADCAA